MRKQKPFLAMQHFQCYLDPDSICAGPHCTLSAIQGLEQANQAKHTLEEFQGL